MTSTKVCLKDIFQFLIYEMQRDASKSDCADISGTVDQVPQWDNRPTPPTRPCSPFEEGSQNHCTMGSFRCGEESSGADEIPEFVHSTAWPRSLWELYLRDDYCFRGVQRPEMGNPGHEQAP